MADERARSEAMTALLAGKRSVEQVARDLRVSAATVEQWRDAAFAASLEGAFGPPSPSPSPSPSLAPPVPVPAFLLATHGKNEGQVFTLTDGVIALGRAPTCEICVDDEGVARRMLTIERTREGFLLTDLNSSSGTFINGTRQDRRVLVEGDRIHVGSSTILRFTTVKPSDEHDQPMSFDGLTGAFTKRVFADRLKRAFALAHTTSSALGLALLDVDHFRTVNDRFGLAIADTALKLIPEVARSVLGPHHLVARYGGDEFGVILADTAGTDALARCEALRLGVERRALDADGERFHVTVSIGLCTLPDPTIPSPQELVRRADSALFEAKQAGRNRVVVAPVG